MRTQLLIALIGVFLQIGLFVQCLLPKLPIDTSEDVTSLEVPLSNLFIHSDDESVASRHSSAQGSLDDKIHDLFGSSLESSSRASKNEVPRPSPSSELPFSRLPSGSIESISPLQELKREGMNDWEMWRYSHPSLFRALQPVDPAAFAPVRQGGLRKASEPERRLVLDKIYSQLAFSRMPDVYWVDAEARLSHDGFRRILFLRGRFPRALQAMKEGEDHHILGVASRPYQVNDYIVFINPFLAPGTWGREDLAAYRAVAAPLQALQEVESPESLKEAWIDIGELRVRTRPREEELADAPSGSGASRAKRPRQEQPSSPQ